MLHRFLLNNANLRVYITYIVHLVSYDIDFVMKDIASPRHSSNNEMRLSAPQISISIRVSSLL